MSARPSLYSAEQVAEMAAYNSTLTPAGQKPSRRGRGGGSRGLTLGGGSGYNPGRPAPGTNGSRSLNAAGHGMLDGHIGTRPPVSRSGTGLPINSRNSRPPPTSNPWASTRFASNPSETSTGGLLTSSLTGKDTAISTQTTSQAQFESMIWAASTPAPGSASVASSGVTRFHGFSQPQNKGNRNVSMGVTSAATAPASVHQTAIMEPPIPASVSGSFLANVTCSPPRVRQPIVSNWNGDRTGSPHIPAHLQQSNAGDTIRAIAVLIDRPYDDLTADGLTLGGGLIEKKRREAETAAAAAAKADQDTAMMETAMSSFDMPGEMEVGSDVQSAPPLGNLADSIWSGPTWNLPSKDSRAVTNSILPAVSIPSPISPIGNATPFTNSENVRPASVATLKDSKWATKSSAGPSYLAAPSQSHQNEWSSTRTSYSSADCTKKSSSVHQTVTPAVNLFSGTPPTATRNARFDQSMSQFGPATSPSSTVTNASSIGQPKNLSSEPSTTIAPANGSWPPPQPRMHPSTIRTWEHDRSHASNKHSNQLAIQSMRTSGLWDAAYAYSTADTPETSPVAAPQPARPTAPSKPEQKLSDSRWARR